MKTIQEDISTFRMGRKELKPRMESIPVRLAPTKVCKDAPHPSFAHSRAPVQQEEGDGGSECVGRGQNVDDASGWREAVRSPPLSDVYTSQKREDRRCYENRRETADDETDIHRVMGDSTRHAARQRKTENRPQIHRVQSSLV